MVNPKLAFAQSLMQQPAGQGWGAIGGAGQQIVGALLARKAMDEDKAQQADFGKMLAGFDPSQPNAPQALATMLMQSENPRAQEAGTQLLSRTLMGGGGDPESCFAPTAMVGPGGSAMMVQASNRGNLRPIEGYSPISDQKPPPMRTVMRGDQEVQQEYGPRGWQDIGAGPRWQPQQQGAEQLVEVADPGSPTGVRYVPRSQAAGAAAPQKGMVLGYDSEGRPVVTMGGAQQPGGAKIPEAIRAKYATQMGLLQGAKEQFDTLKEYNPGFWERVAASGGGVYGPEGAKANSARNSILFAIAQLSEQGALQAPDRAVAEQIIGNVFDPRVGPETRAAAQQQFSDWLASKERGLQNMIAFTPPAIAPTIDPAAQYGRQSATQPGATPKSAAPTSTKSNSLKDMWDSFK